MRSLSSVRRGHGAREPWGRTEAQSLFRETPAALTSGDKGTQTEAGVSADGLYPGSSSRDADVRKTQELTPVMTLFPVQAAWQGFLVGGAYPLSRFTGSLRLTVI